jgi:hypothetical protein
MKGDILAGGTGVGLSEYCGKYRSSARRALIVCSTPAALRKETLSMTTMSLRRKVGVGRR